jgi:hypothetical protein
VADSPSGEKVPVNLAYESEGPSIHEVQGDGNLGGEYEVNDAIMRVLFEQAVNEVIGLLGTL